MPTKGRPRHSIRFDPALWHAFRHATRDDPRGASGVIRDFVCWYLRQTDELPARPPHAAAATGTGTGHAASTSASAIQSRDDRTPADSTDATA